MQISTKGRYALRMMVDLASASGESESYIPLRQVAERQGISEKYLEQIIRPLAHAGLVKSARGVMGGYRLALPASEITVGRVLRTVEGDLAPVPCVGNTTQTCEHRDHCATIGVWRSIKESVEQVVDHVSIQQLVDESKGNLSVCP